MPFHQTFGILIEFLGRATPDHLDGGTHVEHALGLQTDEPEAIAAVLREQPETLLARAQLRLRAPSLALFIRRDDRAPNGVRQSLEASLEQIVGGAQVEALHRLLLAERARDDDHRHVGLCRARGAQRGNAVVIGEVEVAQNDVIRAVRQRPLEAAAIAHARDVALEPRHLEPVVNQLGVLGVVLEMQQPHGRRSAGGATGGWRRGIRRGVSVLGVFVSVH